MARAGAGRALLAALHSSGVSGEQGEANMCSGLPISSGMWRNWHDPAEGHQDGQGPEAEVLRKRG